MGVPKYFRWISERYPLASTLVSEGNVPDFDNLYLDMNGIIHSCSHPQTDADSGPCVARPEHIVFREIFAYVELLFSKIKPKRVFFLAVDGVAPRAKLNQQRARRFRTAYDAGREPFVLDDTDDIVIVNDDHDDSVSYFDSNCITPGTRFMQRLQEHLEYFIAAKIKEDPHWRQVRVILSGPATPGEGEHKIMQFIRHCRAQPDYDANTRHCLYGLDADLIMLGLLSHAPHFCLLREEVKFGSQGGGRHGKGKSRHERVKEAKAANRLQSQRFYLMHLGIVRDYFEEEFVRIHDHDGEGDGDGGVNTKSVERVIDDVILMTMLVGNDFLPNLPHLHVGENALGLLFDAYKALPRHVYLNEGGRVQFDRLAMLLDRLRGFEVEKMEAEWGDKLTHDGGGLPKNTITESMLAVVKAVEEALVVKRKQSVSLFIDNPAIRAFAAVLSHDLNCQVSSVEPDSPDLLTITMNTMSTSSDSDDDDDGDDEAEVAMKRVFMKYRKQKVVSDSVLPPVELAADREKRLLVEWKQDYYRRKLPDADPVDVARHYAVGLQWVVSYYYEGVPSWSWFYPHHYAPHLSDLADCLHKMHVDDVAFELAEPLRPLEQLMAVLPPASGALLPTCLYRLMQSPHLADMYPTKFDSDLNGKRNSWEAVVLIPFIDEHRLIEAVRSVDDQLSVVDRRLNQFGPPRVFEYVGEGRVVKLLSPSPNHFATIPDCPCRVSDYVLPTVPHGTEAGFWTGLMKGVDRQACPGFPSLFVPVSGQGRHVASLDKVSVMVFPGQPTAHPSLVITVPPQLPMVKKGDTVLCDWPFCKSAVVVDPQVGVVTEKARSLLWTSRAVRIPVNDPLVSVQLHGTCTSTTGSTITTTGTDTMVVLPRSLLVTDPDMIKKFREAEERRQRLTASSRYPVGGKVIVLAEGKWFGRVGVITAGPESAQSSVTVSVSELDHKDDHQPIAMMLDQQKPHDPDFMPINQVARLVGVPVLLVSKLTSSFMVFDDDHRGGTPGKHDIGLRVKYEGRRLFQWGACRRNPQGYFEYHRSVVDQLSSYKKLFPDLFTGLVKTVSENKLSVSLLFPDLSTQEARHLLTTVKRWLNEQGVGRTALVGEGTVMAGAEACERVAQMRLDRHIASASATTTSSSGSIALPSSAVISQAAPHDCRHSDRHSFRLGQRVRYTGQVYPFGHLGTVVGVIVAEGTVVVEVLFDKPLPGLAGNLDGRCRDHCGVAVQSSDVFAVDWTDLAISVPGSATTIAASNSGAMRRVSVSSLFGSASKGNADSGRRVESKKTIDNDLVALFKQKAVLSDTKKTEETMANKTVDTNDDTMDKKEAVHGNPSIAELLRKAARNNQ